MEVKRDTYLDSTKTILVFLVIFVHCINRLGGGDLLINTARQMAIFVDMPLFVFISGYFTRLDKSIRDNCIGIFSSFVLFQIIWTIINPPHSIRDMLSPAITLWYLLSLCYWRIMIKTLNRITKNKMIWFVGSLVMIIVAGFVPLSTEFSFQRTFSFFPFFVLGNMVRGTNVINKIRGINKILATTLLLLVGAVMYYLHPNLLWLLHGKRPFFDYPTLLALGPFVKLVWLICVSILSILFMAIVPDISLLAKEGKKTLTVYLFHYFPIYFLYRVGFQTNNFLLIIFISLSIYLFTSIIHNYKIIRKMTCPVN